MPGKALTLTVNLIGAREALDQRLHNLQAPLAGLVTDALILLLEGEALLRRLLKDDLQVVALATKALCRVSWTFIVHSRLEQPTSA